MTTMTTPRRGDLGTYGMGTDAYAAVVTDATASGKTIWIRTVGSTPVKNTTVGTGFEAREVIPDPEDIDHKLSLPPREATKRTVEYDGGTFEVDDANAPTKLMLRDGSYRGTGGHGRFTPGKVIEKRDPHL